MPNYACFLITILYERALMRCALRVPKLKISGDCEEYPMEPENRKAIHALLPLHVQECGPIVAIEEIFEVHVTNKEKCSTRSASEHSCTGCWSNL